MQRIGIEIAREDDRISVTPHIRLANANVASPLLAPAIWERLIEKHCSGITPEDVGFSLQAGVRNRPNPEIACRITGQPDSDAPGRKARVPTLKQAGLMLPICLGGVSVIMVHPRFSQSAGQHQMTLAPSICA